MLPKQLLLLLLAQAQLLVVAVGVDGGVEFAYEGFVTAGLALDGIASVTPDGLLLLTNHGRRWVYAPVFHGIPKI
jgi:hypothetical protein